MFKSIFGGLEIAMDEKAVKVPLVFAHRGANSFGPENSLTAFRKALELGCDGVELDVRFTADEEVIVFHDRNTLRLTGVRGKIRQMTLDQIRRLRLRQNSFPPEKIPTLREVLELLDDKLHIIIEIKKEIFVRNRFEEKVLRILKEFGMERRVTISSFNPFVLKKFAHLNGHLELGFIYSHRRSTLILNGQNISSLHSRFTLITNHYLRKLKQRGKKIIVWTVDSAEDMRDMIRKGVDGIITDKPELYFEVVKELKQPGNRGVEISRLNI